MSWFFLILAGFLDIGVALGFGRLKHLTGLNLFLETFGVIAFLILSLFLLYQATKEISIGTAYAVWTGVGAGGTALAGIIFFNDPVNFWRIFFILLLTISITGVKLASE
jgi:quaternary ammonium compound-resistance protein SugE